MNKAYALAVSLTLGCSQSRPEFREGACEARLSHPDLDEGYRSDFEDLFEVGPNPSLTQGDNPKPLDLSGMEYMNPLFHDEDDPGFLGTVGSDAKELFGSEWSELSKMAFDTAVLYVGHDAELCLTGHRTQNGIHQTTYDVVHSPGYTQWGPGYIATSFVVQVDENSGDIWVAERGEPTSIDR